MKILLVHNAYQQPGGEDIVFAQERQLLERSGHQVVAYCRSNAEIADLSPLRRLALVKQVVWAADTRREMARLIRRERPDLVHVHNTFLMVSPSVYAACKAERVPVVQTLHNYRLLCPAATFYRDGHVCEECVEENLCHSVAHGCYRESRAQTAGLTLMLEVHRLLRTWTKMVDGYVALTEFARQRFIAAGLSPERVFTKPNFLYPDPGERVDRGQYALFVGRLSPEKGLETLLAAWRLLGSPIPLVVVGAGPLGARLAAEAARHRLRNVSWTGYLTRAETCRAIKGATFLLLPSGCYENFPMSIVEAFACGVPVICSRLGAMQEIVADGRTGLHFTAGDAQDLARKVEWAWTHHEQVAEMGKEARRQYETKYTAEKNYSLLTGIYQRVIEAQRAVTPKQAKV
jgi:glycosyltransferase involved in cell wall biosynthesis